MAPNPPHPTSGDDSADDTRRLDPGLTRTASPPEGTPVSPSVWSATGTAGSFDHGRFTPGVVLEERYRIIELLGRGGMGEVYRADDLKLGQMIAVKFLSKTQRIDQEALAGMLNEVRTARQISHSNVCRVYDIGETEGQPFITMEYVDGENLSVLLKRIGRLPADKGVELARQLCAGLAAAHDAGILHRDLKPSNVMLDGRGRVRITDFGLAAVADQLRSGAAAAGTPAYMSPEQLTGREVSTRSDIYAVGLVMYEMFTGQRAFRADSLAELTRLHTSQRPTHPSKLVGDLEPAVARVILNCLEKDPFARPPTALAVAAALPGGDPLAAALAAGETPSPELVAASGRVGGLSPLKAWGLLAFTLGAFLLTAWVNQHRLLSHFMPFDKPPAVLVDRGREMLVKLGYTAAPADSAYGFDLDRWLVRRLTDLAQEGYSDWAHVLSVQPPVIKFWMRESPATLSPRDAAGIVTLDDPPPLTPGMIEVELTPDARLHRLRVTPPERAATSAPAAATAWPVLFALAGLDLNVFEPCPPRQNPPVFCDELRAWCGRYPGEAALPVVVEAGAVQGRVVTFRIMLDHGSDVPPTAAAARATSEAASTVINVLAIGLLIGAALLARRNLALERGDRRGAARLGLGIGLSVMLAWTLAADHVASPAQELGNVFRAAGIAMVQGGVIWLLYLALEPAVRRSWPDSMVSWTRLLSGRFTDPHVGRDILLGAAVAMLTALIGSGRLVLADWLPGPVLPPALIDPGPMMLPRQAAALVVSRVGWAVSSALFVLLLLVLLVKLLRGRTLAIAAFALLLGAFVCVTAAKQSVQPALTAATALLFVGVMTFALVRFGLLATVVALYLQMIAGSVPLRFDAPAWQTPAMLIGVAAVVGVTLYAFRLALGSPPLLKQPVLER